MAGTGSMSAQLLRRANCSGFLRPAVLERRSSSAVAGSGLVLRSHSFADSKQRLVGYRKDCFNPATPALLSQRPNLNRNIVCMSNRDQDTLTKPREKSNTGEEERIRRQKAGTEERPAMPRVAEDTSLGLANRFLNVAAPVTIFLTVAVTSPVLVVWRGLKRLVTSPIDMRDKVVVVTGASSGIGMHLAYEYSQLNSRLVLVARREDKLEAVAEECRRRGAPEAFILQADLATEEGCRDAVEQAAQHYGRVDCLVLNAGIAQIYKFEEVEDTSGFKPIMDVNFWGYVYCAKYALKYLRESGGQIVVNDSIVEFVPEPNLSLYNASKAAVSQFFETVRLELGDAIPITIFQPGVIKSEMTDGKVLRADGQWSAGGEEAKNLREEAGFGLFPTLPTPALAKAAVAAARRKTQRAVIPSWYMSMFYLRLLSPELFRASLSWLFRGDRTPVKAAQDKMGGGFKVPSDADLREGGYRNREE